MFENNTKKGKTPRANSSPVSPSVNMISEGTSIQGEVSSNGDIRIDGKLSGMVFSKSKVVIGSSGVVEGDIRCQSADVLGRITGTIEVKEILYLKSSANIQGDITTDKMVVESGAIFNGSCSMGSKQSIVNEEKFKAESPRKEAVLS